MSDLKYYIEDKGLTEEEMVKNISIIVEDINHKYTKTKKSITHFWFQIMGIIFSMFLDLPNFVPISFGFSSFLFLLLSGHFSLKRTERINDYWFIIIKCKESGVLNKDNFKILEKFEIKK